MKKKGFGYLFYVIGIIFTISYFRESILLMYEYFEVRDWFLFIVSFIGFIFNICFTAILFVYARKWTSKQALQTVPDKPVGPMKKVIGFILFPLGVLLIISFIGNIYVWITNGIPEANANKFAGLMALVMTVVFTVFCFKYGIKWTKKYTKVAAIEEIGNE